MLGRILLLAALCHTPTIASAADQQVPDPQVRVVSLSPGLTELVVRLGAVDQLVGRTRFCDQPEAVLGKTVVGGIMDPNWEVLVGLRPDLVLVSELTPRQAVERAQAVLPNARVVRVEYNSWPSLLKGIGRIGELLNCADEAGEIIAEFERAEEQVASQPLLPMRAALIYGHLKTEAAGAGTFPDELLQRLGIENIAARTGLSAWPKLTAEYILEANPDVIFVADTDVESVVLAGGPTLARYRRDSVWRNLAAVQSGAIVLIPSRRLYIPDSNLADTLLQMHKVLADWQAAGQARLGALL